MSKYKKTITKREYYTIMGILQLCKRYNEKLQELEQEIGQILEVNTNDISGSSGHVSDAVYGETSLEDMLEWMGIKVKTPQGKEGKE